MRTVLNIALLLISFAVGQVSAAEVSGQQAQLLMSVAKNLAVGASGEFKLTIGQMEITFTVSRSCRVP